MAKNVRTYDDLQYTYRRGNNLKRQGVGLFNLQELKRKFMPKWADFGDASLVRGEIRLDFNKEVNEHRRQGHEHERQKSTLNRNKKQTTNPMKTRRNYWHQT